MDFSKLSDSDLQAAYAGKWEAVSDEGLKLLSASEQEPETMGTGEDVTRSLASGIARSVPKGIDFGGAVLAKGYDLATGGKTPFSTYSDAGPLNKLTSKVLGDEYQPQTGVGSVAKFGGEVLGPWGALGALKGAAGFARGAAGLAPVANKTGAALTAAKEAAYKAADDSGVVFNPSSFQVMAGEAGRKLADEGLDTFDGAMNQTPYTYRTMQRVNEQALTPKTLSEVETLRKVTRGAPASNPADARLSGILRKRLDDYAQTATPIAGDSAGAAKVKEARGLAAQEFRNERVDDIFKAVDLRAPGTTKETALKNGFRNLAKDAEFMSSISAVERKAIEDAARTGAGERLLRSLSVFSPTSGKLGAAITGGAGVASLANPAALALPAVGFGADVLYGSRVASKANKARDLVYQSGARMPSISERFGTLVRGKLK